MIIADQPTIFPDNVLVRISDISDGNMRFGRGDDAATLQNREKFFAAIDVPIESATLVQVTYDRGRFDEFMTVSDVQKSQGMVAPISDIISDSLVVDTPSHALFLPLADCCGVVLYDPDHSVLMLAHIGRHGAVEHAGEKAVEFLSKKYQSKSSKLLVWLSPAVGKSTYPLYECGGRSLHEEIVRQLTSGGVDARNIEVSPVDTATSKYYFSHSEFKKGNRDFDGRFAVVAMMRR